VKQMSVATFFDAIVAELESVEGASADATLGTLTLGSREASTGWRAVTYPTSTIHMPIVPQGTVFNYMGVGLFAYESALGITDDTVKLGDQIKSSDNRYYSIAGVEKVYWLNKFAFWKATLLEVPAWEAAPGTLTWSKTRLGDARINTRTFLSTYIRNAQITKDDDSTTATWASMFSKPPYPAVQEFRAASSAVQGLYVVGKPSVESTLGVRYDEDVPIDIKTVNSTGCTGTALNYKMEDELRYACDKYPHGSLRLIGPIKDSKKQLGFTVLYSTTFILKYRRTSQEGKA